MILIEPNRTGAMWLRAMFRYFCRKNNCGVRQISASTFQATGAPRQVSKTHYDYELAHAKLHIFVINAIANSNKKDQNHTTLVATRQFVKNLYRTVAV